MQACCAGAAARAPPPLDCPPTPRPPQVVTTHPFQHLRGGALRGVSFDEEEAAREWRGTFVKARARGGEGAGTCSSQLLSASSRAALPTHPAHPRPSYPPPTGQHPLPRLPPARLCRLGARRLHHQRVGARGRRGGRAAHAAAGGAAGGGGFCENRVTQALYYITPIGSKAIKNERKHNLFFYFFVVCMGWDFFCTSLLGRKNQSASSLSSGSPTFQQNSPKYPFLAALRYF